MKKHLIVLDLDGTLLTDKKIITERSKQAINQVRESGHIVVIATGRPHYASIDYYEELNLNTPMINFNGAYLHHPTDQQWEALHSPLSRRTALEIVAVCDQIGVHNIMAEVLGNIYIDHYDEEFIQLLHIDRTNGPIHVGNLKNQLDDDPTSLIIYPSEDQVEKLREALNRDHASVIDHRHWGAPWHMIEVVRKGMNKGVAVDRIARYYHIEPENVIAFGDEDNDLEMIQYAGIGVAMENAANQLKKVATDVTATNESDGVAIFLENFFI